MIAVPIARVSDAVRISSMVLFDTSSYSFQYVQLSLHFAWEMMCAITHASLRAFVADHGKLAVRAWRWSNDGNSGV